MKTIKHIQTAVTVVALLVAVKLADSMNPTTNELLGSITLAVTGVVSMVLQLAKEEKETEVEVDF